MVEKLSVDIPQFCSLSTGSSVTAEIEIKRSQFICYLQRVENEPVSYTHLTLPTKA